MNDRAARIVEGAELEEIAVRRPNPVADGRVDEKAPCDREGDEGRKFHAFGPAADNERGREDRKSHLKEDEENFRDRSRAGINADAGEKRFREPAREGRAR